MVDLRVGGEREVEPGGHPPLGEQLGSEGASKWDLGAGHSSIAPPTGGYLSDSDAYLRKAVVAEGF